MTLLDIGNRSDNDRSTKITQLARAAARAAHETHTLAAHTRQSANAAIAVEMAARAGSVGREARTHADNATSIARTAGQSATTRLMRRAAITLLRSARQADKHAVAAERDAADAVAFAAAWHTASALRTGHGEVKAMRPWAHPHVRTAHMEHKDARTGHADRRSQRDDVHSDHTTTRALSWRAFGASVFVTALVSTLVVTARAVQQRM